MCVKKYQKNKNHKELFSSKIGVLNEKRCKIKPSRHLTAYVSSYAQYQRVYCKPISQVY